jgi:NitT/TauT family transport system permease protein
MNTLWRYSPLILLAVLWEGASRLGVVSDSVLPPLSSVIESWWELLGDLFANGGPSLYRGIVGLGLAIGIGGTLGISMAFWKPANLLFSPIVEVFYPVPKSALIPVTALWLGFGDASKVLLIFLGCILPVTIGAYNGARGSDNTLIWSARSLGASRLRVLRDVVIPSAMPELLNGIRTSLALAFILIVASELIVAKQGFGYLIGFLGDGGNYAGMFAVTLTVAALGFAADRGYLYAMHKVLAWRE